MSVYNSNENKKQRISKTTIITVTAASMLLATLVVLMPTTTTTIQQAYGDQLFPTDKGATPPQTAREGKGSTGLGDHGCDDGLGSQGNIASGDKCARQGLVGD